MDAQHFDTLARALGATATRRVALRTLGAGTLAAMFGLRSGDATAGTCRPLFEVCTRTRQCCGSRKKKKVCALNEHGGAIPTEPSCCVPEGKPCTFGGECCGGPEVQCRGEAGSGRCG
jgi:hypothetical protein